MDSVNKIYVIDTCVILDNPSNIIKLYDNGNTIIVPEVVIDELDAKKSGFDEINYNAREFARFLEEAEIIFKEQKGDLLFIKTRIESLNVELYIVSKNEYRCESSKIALNILNDRKILEVSKDSQEFFPNILFISLDIMARTRALSLGIKAETLKGKDQKLEFQFHKTIEIENAHMYDGKSILELDSEYELENFSYTVIDSVTGKPFMGQVENGHLYYFDDSIFKQKVKPINKEQKFLTNAILSGHSDVVCVDAKAGSGKTLIALATAMELVKQKKYGGILYIRNSIESTAKGEDIGYLPGLESKFAIYNHPLMDSLMFIAKSELKKSNANKSKANTTVIDNETLKEKVSELMTHYNIETVWCGEARGRTFSNVIVICDEFQNFSGSTGQLILSRLDKDCKAICIGSNKQIDNMYTNKHINSLTTLLKATKEEQVIKLFACELNTVVRGPITEFAEKIFSQK